MEESGIKYDNVEFKKVWACIKRLKRLNRKKEEHYPI